MINSYCPRLIQICYMMHMSVKKKIASLRRAEVIARLSKERVTR